MKQTLIILIAIGVYSLSYSQNALYGVTNGATTSREGWTCKCDRCIKCKKDTLASHLLITGKPPAFSHSIEGYCIVVGGSCIGKHLVYRSTRPWLFGRRRWAFIAIDPSIYDVWRCIRKEVRHD